MKTIILLIQLESLGILFVALVVLNKITGRKKDKDNK